MQAIITVGMAALVMAALTLPAATLYVSQESTNPVFPYLTWATAAAHIQEAVDAALTDDEIVVSNGVYATGARPVGTNTLPNRVIVHPSVTLRSVNGPQSTFIVGSQAPPVRCVYLCSNAILSGFTLTNGAAPWSQTEEERLGGGILCQSSTAVISNCVIIGNRAFEGGGAAFGALKSCTINSNLATQGGGAAASALIDCQINGNQASREGTWDGIGGGVGTSRLTNCIVCNNSAADSGGGANSCTLINCKLTDNRAAEAGGAIFSELINCTLTGNYATNRGGGAFYCAAKNCIIYFNTAAGAANYNEELFAPPVNYCCTFPLPTNGVGNILLPPQFVDYAGGDLRLQSNSPCINAGNNSYLADACLSNCLDLDHNPRVAGGTVDIGAYEFQQPGSVISYAWLQNYNLPTDGSVDYTDTDHDGMNNWQEWRCQTDPTNALSALRLISARRIEGSTIVTWQSVYGVPYFLERGTYLGGTSDFRLLATGIAGEAGATSFADTSAGDAPTLFYRVGVNGR